jgi:hypothetical protein
MFGDAPLPMQAVAQILEQGWRLRVDELRHERVGYGSHHWVAVTADGDRWFVTADDIAHGWPILEAFELTRQLADAGLEFVRAPARDRDGGVVRSLDGQWISLWPWIIGRTRAWGDAVPPEETGALLDAVRRLHGVDWAPVPSLIDDWAIEARRQLQTALDEVDEDWEPGPYTDGLQARLRAGRAAIGEWLASYDRLVDVVTARRPRFVITHGEPKSNNVIHAASGPVLIDWDTVRWAPAERDLWMIPGAGGDPEALAAYRLRWKLTDTALAVAALRGASTVDPDLDAAWHGLDRDVPT